MSDDGRLGCRFVDVLVDSAGRHRRGGRGGPTAVNIAPHDLAAEFYRARSQWPFLDDVERQFGLPRCLLYAVGSRETHLTNERGDGGHGWGVWQLDDRSHTIPASYLDDVRQQAVDAAAHLADNFARFSDWTAACNAYNSGQPSTGSTAHHDYGPDVIDRCRFLAGLASPLPTPTPNPVPVMEVDVQIANTAKTAFLSVVEAGIVGPPNAGYELHADGGIDAINGAPFYGGYFNKPESVWKAPQPQRTFLTATPRGDGQPGYVIWAADGAFYAFGPDLWDPATQVAA